MTFEDINPQDYTGKNIAIIGIPGTGKTTLSRLICTDQEIIHTDDYYYLGYRGSFYKVKDEIRGGRKMTDKSNCLTSASMDFMYYEPSGLAAKFNPEINADKSGMITEAFGRGGSSDEFAASVSKIAKLTGRIRRLTPIECERLQTVPDNYTASVSDTQRYKMLGNGWTVDVIVHILKHL